MGVPTSLARAKQLAVYWDNYIEYLAKIDDRQPNIGKGDPKPPQTELYVKPFALDLAAGQYLKANGTEERWGVYKGSFTGYVKETINAGGGEAALKLRNVTPAKIVIKTGLSTTKQVIKAKTTKRDYVTYGGKAGSIPFGVKTAGETEVEAYNALVQAIKGSGFDEKTTRVSRIKEKA